MPTFCARLVKKESTKLLAVLAAGILIPSIHAALHLEVHHGAGVNGYDVNSTKSSSLVLDSELLDYYCLEGEKDFLRMVGT